MGTGITDTLMPIILQEKRHRVTCCPEAIFKRTLPFASAYSFNSYEPVSAPPAYSRLWGQGVNTTRSLPSARFQRGKRRPSFPAEWSQAACGGAVDTDGAGDEQRRRQHSAPEVTGQLSRRFKPAQRPPGQDPRRSIPDRGLHTRACQDPREPMWRRFLR